MEPVDAGFVPSPGSVPARFGGVYGQGVSDAQLNYPLRLGKCGD